MEPSFLLPNSARSTASHCSNAHQKLRGFKSGTTIVKAPWKSYSKRYLSRGDIRINGGNTKKLWSKGREWAKTLIPLDSGVAQLLSKEMRSNVWCPKRRLTWSQALLDNIYTIRTWSASGREIGWIFTRRNIVNIKAEIVFPAWMKNVFRNTADFRAPAASIVKGRLQDAVVGENVHSWRGKVFPKRKQRMQQRLGLEDVNMLRIVQPVIPGLQSLTAQAQNSAPSRLWSIAGKSVTDASCSALHRKQSFQSSRNRQYSISARRLVSSLTVGWDVGKSGCRSGHQSRLLPLLQMLYVDWV